MAWICSSKMNFNGKRNVKQYGDFCYAVSFSDRFAEDKIDMVSDGVITVLDGVLLNKSEIFKRYNVKNLHELFENNGGQIDILKELIGPFSGFIYEIEKKQLTAFGNQTGDTCVFWHCSDEHSCVSSDFNSLMVMCKDNGVKTTFNEVAANHLLSLGFIVEGNTVANQIYRTQPGELVKIQSDAKVVVERYHLFDNTHPDETISLEDAVEKVDQAFKKAVRRCFDKDLEYGYKHLADMSGGLDSRIVNRVAREEGYNDITNISYSQSESREFVCASQASKAMGNSFIYKQLDDALFIYDIEKIVPLNYGLSVYYGITGGLGILESMNFNVFGLEHTGMIGDAVVGSFSKNEDDTQIDVKRICYTDFITPSLENVGFYNNHEQFCMYYRAFQGAVMTHYIRRNFTEVVSPFLDMEFLQTCFDIPLKYRCGDLLYWTWIDKKYPDIAHIPCTHSRPSNNSISREAVYNMLGRKLRRKIIKFFKKIGLWRVVSPTSSMNPFEQWYYEFPSIRKFIEDYHDSNIEQIKKMYPSIYDTLEKVYSGEKTMDKLSALGLIGVIKTYFMEN